MVYHDDIIILLAMTMDLYKMGARTKIMPAQGTEVEELSGSASTHAVTGVDATASRASILRQGGLCCPFFSL